MNPYRIVVIGGWCGNRMLMVADYLTELLARQGFYVRLTTHSVWENYSSPPPADLVLQLLPAFTPAETGCPVLSIRPMIVDLEHPETIARILQQVTAGQPAAAGCMAAVMVQ